MIQVGDRLRLGLEPPDVGLAGELAGPDHLQRHQPIEADLAGLVDDPHAADRQLIQQLVIAESTHAVHELPGVNQVGEHTGLLS